MEIKEITVEYGGTINMGNHNFAKMGVTITALLTPYDPISDVFAELWDRAKESVREQALELMARPGCEADPRFVGQAPATNGHQEPEATNGAGDSSPLPKTLGDLVTPKQLWMLRGLAREGGFDAENECQGFYSCRLEDISKRAASALIDHFKRLVAKAEEAARMPD